MLDGKTVQTHGQKAMTRTFSSTSALFKSVIREFNKSKYLILNFGFIGGWG